MAGPSNLNRPRTTLLRLPNEILSSIRDYTYDRTNPAVPVALSRVEREFEFLNPRNIQELPDEIIRIIAGFAYDEKDPTEPRPLSKAADVFNFLNPTNIQELPDEALRNISEFAGARASRSLATTSRRMSSIFSSRAMDSIVAGSIRSKYEYVYYVLEFFSSYVSKLKSRIEKSIDNPERKLGSFMITLMDALTKGLMQDRDAVIITNGHIIRRVGRRTREGIDFNKKCTKFVSKYVKGEFDANFFFENSAMFQKLRNKHINQNTPRYNFIYTVFLYLFSQLIRPNMHDYMEINMEITIKTIDFAIKEANKTLNYEDPNLNYIKRSLNDIIHTIMQLSRPVYTYRSPEYLLDFVSLAGKLKGLEDAIRDMESFIVSLMLGRETAPSQDYISRPSFNIGSRKSPKKKRSTRKSPKKPKKSIKKKRSTKKTSRK